MDEFQPQTADVKKILEENLRLTKEIHAMTKKVKNYVTFQKIMSLIYLMLFVVPLILAVVYLPKFLTDYLAPFQELLNPGQPPATFNNTQDILNQAQKMLIENSKQNNQ